MENNNEIKIEEIKKCLPHRYPFLLVDKVIQLEKNQSAIGVKNVTINENFFVGHFPAKPVMPGVLIIESLAQTAGVLAIKSLGVKNKLILFTSIEDAKFRKAVVPGDQLLLHVKILKHRLNLWKMEGVAKVDGKVVAEAKFSAMLVDNDE